MAVFWDFGSQNDILNLSITFQLISLGWILKHSMIVIDCDIFFLDGVIKLQKHCYVPVVLILHHSWNKFGMVRKENHKDTITTPYK